MSEATLDDVFALNEELAALADVGIPASVPRGTSGSGVSRHSVSSTLEQVNHSLALRTNLGQSLIAATSQNQDIPPVYRSALEVGLRCNCLSATLDGLSRQAAGKQEIRSTIGRSLVSPLIILMLGYLGFIYLCLAYAPTIVGLYEQVQQAPSGPVRFLLAMREWLPYWAVLLPLLALVGVVCWLRGWGNWEQLVPGARRYAASVRHANFTHQLTLLLESGVSLSESLPLAAAVTGNQALVTASTSLSAAHARQARLSADSEELRVLPPLLRWAFTGDLGGQPLPEILRFAEKTYRHIAERRAAVLRFALPTVVGAFFGGSIVLAYGICVFGPFVHLLKDLV